MCSHYNLTPFAVNNK